MIELLLKRTSEELSALLATTSFEEEKLVGDLFTVFKAVWTSILYNEEDETTLDHYETDNATYVCDEDSGDPCHYSDNEENDEEQATCESFSLSYIKRAVADYDALNLETGQQAHT